MKHLISISLVSFAILLCSCGKKTEKTTPIRKDITEMVFASGILEAENTYKLTAQTDGYLTEVTFKEGDYVQANQVLARIDNLENEINLESSEKLYGIAEKNIDQNAPALLQAQFNLEKAKSQFTTDSMQFGRYTSLFEKQTISKSEYENHNLQYISSRASYYASKENYRLIKQQADQQFISSKASKGIQSRLSNHNQIKAILSGRVYYKWKQVGDYVRRGDVIATIGDATQIYAKVNIDESTIEKVHLGQTAIVQLNTIKNKTFQGKVAEIYPAFDEASQSFLCKIIFTDSLEFRIVGTQLQANIVVGTQKNALLIPNKYLNFDGSVTLDGHAQNTPVTTNFISNEWVHITSGITEKSILVTESVGDNEQKTSELGSQMR